MGWFCGLFPPMAVIGAVEYLIRGSRRMAFQAIVSGSLSFILLVWQPFGTFANLFWWFWLIMPLLTVRILRTLDWPRPSELKKASVWSVVIQIVGIIGIFGILTAIAIPQNVKYIKRSRTSNSVDHARMICTAVTDWIAAANKSDASRPSRFDPDAIGEDGKKFKERFPSEADWMANGDSYYRFEIVAAGPGPKDSVVVASAKSDSQIYASKIQAGGTSSASGWDLSGCKVNVEEVSGKY
jgi:Tfp pilus assembly major pilin PilA